MDKDTENTKENTTSFGPSLLSFFAGAAVGAVVVALTTPKPGYQVRRSLKTFAIRTKRKAEDLTDDASDAWSEAKERTSLPGEDLMRGVSDAADDLRGKGRDKK